MRPECQLSLRHTFSVKASALGMKCVTGLTRAKVEMTLGRFGRVFLMPDPPVFARQALFSATGATFSIVDQTFSVTDQTKSIKDKTFSATDQTKFDTDSTFSVQTKPFPSWTKPFPSQIKLNPCRTKPFPSWTNVSPSQIKLVQSQTNVRRSQTKPFPSRTKVSQRGTLASACETDSGLPWMNWAARHQSAPRRRTGLISFLPLGGLRSTQPQSPPTQPRVPTQQLIDHAGYTQVGLWSNTDEISASVEERSLRSCFAPL